MVGEGNKTFQAVFGLVFSIISMFFSAISVFNFFTGYLRLPISDAFHPIIDFWQTYIISNIERLNISVPWIVPEWDPDFYAMALIITTITTGGLLRYNVFESKEDDDSPIALILTPFGIVALFAIPFVGRFIAWAMILLAVGTLFFGSRMAVQDKEEPLSRKALEHRKRGFNKLQGFLWGIVLATVAGLIANAYV